MYGGPKMFEAKCEKCEAVYSTQEENMPNSFECMCGCANFSIKENSLIVA